MDLVIALLQLQGMPREDAEKIATAAQEAGGMANLSDDWDEVVEVLGLSKEAAAVFF